MVHKYVQFKYLFILTQTQHHPFPVKKKMKFIEENGIKERGYLIDSLWAFYIYISVLAEQFHFDISRDAFQQNSYRSLKSQG